MKALLILLVLLLSNVSCAGSDAYDSRYCHDPEPLETWRSLVDKNSDSDQIGVQHALWIGLCVQVEAHDMTTDRANRIFETFRSALLDQVDQNRAENNADEI